MPAPLIVIGAGLVGSAAATAAVAAGREVIVLDAGEPCAASPAASGLFVDGWCASLGVPPADLREALTSLWPTRGVAFGRQGKPPLSALFVRPSEVLWGRDPARPVRRARVVAVQARGAVTLDDGDTLEGFVLVAAGAWAGRLVPGLGLTGRSGVAWGWKTAPPRPVMREWAPYRHAIAFDRDGDGGGHFADGTALARPWGPAEDERALGIAASLGLSGVPRARHLGIRPYRAGGALWSLRSPRLAVAVGAAKSGVALAPWWARRTLDALRAS